MGLTCEQLLNELLQNANVVTRRNHQHLALGLRIANEVLLRKVCKPAVLPPELLWVVCDDGEAVIECWKGDFGAEPAPCNFAVGVEDLLSSC